MKVRELPKGWEWKRLGDIFSLSSGKSRPEKIENVQTDTKKFPIYGGNGILGYSNEFFIQNPTIIIGRVGQYCGSVYVSSEKCWISDNALYADNLFSNKIDLTYLARVLCKINLNQFKKKFGQPLITQKIVYDQYIPLPPLPVQRQIVAVLEQVEAVKRHRHEADALTGALLQSVFYEMFGDPVRNEKGWEQSKLGDCCRVQRGKFTYRPRNEPRFYGGNYPFIQTGDVANCKGKLKKYTQTLNDEGLSISKMFPKGTIVISIAANIGDTAILDFDSCFPDSVVGISPDNSKGTVEFFEMMLRFYKEHLWNLAPETAQRNINLRILSELEVIIPPLALQQQFARVVQDVERIREQQVASGRQIEGLCEGLMARAFAGELTVV